MLQNKLLIFIIDDAFKLTVDQIFPKIIKKPNVQPGKPTISSDKKPVALSQVPLNLNLKPSPKEEINDSKIVAESPKPNEEENAEKVDKIEGEKENPEINIHEANASNIADMIGGNQPEAEKKEAPPAEILEMKPEPLVKSVSSPVRAEKAEEPTPSVIFSVVGYSDTENMW